METGVWRKTTKSFSNSKTAPVQFPGYKSKEATDRRSQLCYFDLVLKLSQGASIVQVKLPRAVLASKMRVS